jgi:hypothetical protein
VAAAGGKTSKVTIETDPPGAKVYFGLKEDGVVCTTPCTIDAPIGETAIIVEAENRRPLFENLVIRKKTARPLRVQYKLEPAVGTLIVEGGAGAMIKLDEEDAGVAPRRIDDVQAGGHHVAIERNGKQIFDDFVEIEAGAEATVLVPTAPLAPTPADQPAVTATAPSAAHRSPAVAASAVIDIGFRQFSYEGNTTPMTQRNGREAGQVLAGAILELWPTTLAGLSVLPGLSLYGRFEYGLTPHAVIITDSVTHMNMSTSLTTSWQNLEISLHHRWTITDAGTIEVGTGYVDDRYRFTGKPEEIAIVPDAAYKAMRIGGRASLLFGQVEPYITIENRIVLQGGAMDKRYKLGASVFGVRGSIGSVAHFGSFEVRLEGGATLYSWTFRPDGTEPAQAQGGNDVIESLMLAIGYQR